MKRWESVCESLGFVKVDLGIYADPPAGGYYDIKQKVGREALAYRILDMNLTPDEIVEAYRVKKGLV